MLNPSIPHLQHTPPFLLVPFTLSHNASYTLILVGHKSTSVHLPPRPDFWYTAFSFLIGAYPLHAVLAFSRSALGYVNRFSFQSLCRASSLMFFPFYLLFYASLSFRSIFFTSVLNTPTRTNAEEGFQKQIRTEGKGDTNASAQERYKNEGKGETKLMQREGNLRERHSAWGFMCPEVV